MTIAAELIADSISEQRIRVRTFMCRYPRFIHAELMTHRVFSRNASSSRAIPVERMIADLRRDPAMPVYWGANQKGMQAGAELQGFQQEAVRTAWLHGLKEMIAIAEQMVANGLHKQIANRILEPWAHINVVITATDFENFYTLRRHKDAQPEIKVLADAMWEAEQASTPRLLKSGEWHLPFINADDWQDAYLFAKKGRITRDEPAYGEKLDIVRKVSVARCARTSYLTFDGKASTIEEDMALFEKLVVAQPLHASPAEHQCTPDMIDERDSQIFENPHLHGNLRGWIQYRKILPGEFIPG